MARFVHLALVALVATVLLLVAYWFQSWGALALLLMAGVGWGWYRVQVVRSAAAEKFFGDAGEETRMTGFQGGSPSEMPVDRQPPGAAGGARDRS
jgi:hypothetical protein